MVFHRQDKIEYDEERSKINELKFSGLHDHSKCVQATDGELKIDHDADLIDNEGDPLEEFETYENLTDHSKCTLAWQEDWEDANECQDLFDNLKK